MSDDVKEIELFGLTFEYEDGSDTIFAFKEGAFYGKVAFLTPEKAEVAFKKLEFLANLEWVTNPTVERLRQEAPKDSPINSCPKCGKFLYACTCSKEAP